MRSILAVFVMAFLIVRTGFFVSSTYAAAGINETINFQGKLVGNTGLNVADGNYDVVFYLYAASSGGSPLWTETWNSGTSQVTITDGVFRVALGTHSSFSSFDFNQDSLYLAIKVGTDAEMTPRIRFTSVPYAFVAKTVVDDALDFAQFQDILDLDANLTVNQTGYTWTQTFTGTTTNALTYNSTSLTSGSLVAISPANVAQTGNSLYVSSTSTAAATNGLARFNFTGAHTGNGLQVDDVTTTGNAVAINSTALTTGTGLLITGGTTLQAAGELLDLNMGAATTGSAATLRTTGVFTNTAGLLNITANAATTGYLAAFSGTGLTTGTGLLITGGTTLQAAGELLDLNMGAATTGSAATLRTTGVFTNTAGLLSITANAATTGYLAAFSGTGLTTGTGLLITGGAAMAANGELLDLNMGAAVAGNGANVTTTGVYTGTGLLTLTANSATTGDIMSLSATGLTTGSGIVMTGPSSTGVTDHFLKITSDVGSASSLIYGAPDFSGSTVTGYGLNITATDSTATANTDYANYSLLTLTGNAAKSGYGTYGRVTTASTTADTTYGGYFSTATTGAVTTGTQSTYGLYATTTSANVAGGTVNAYGGYFQSGGTVASGTINSYGLYIANGTMNTTGTANNFGLYVEAPTGADTNVAGYFGGNVGIGTTSPTGKLTISSSQASSLIPFLQFVPTGTAGINTVSYFGGASNKAGELMAIGDYGSSAAPYHLYYSESDGANPALVDAWQTSRTSVTQTNADIFFTRGSVGIGTTAPTQALHVVGSARITGALYDSSNSAGSSTNILTSTGTGTAWSSLSSALDTTYFKQNGNSFTALAVLGTNDAYGLAFETSNTERLRIDASGNVGIGTTSPLAKLEVKDPSSITQQSAEMIINLDDRTFGSDLTHWSGTNWTIGSGVSTHTAGANAYTLSNTYLTSAPVASNVYVVSVTVNTTTTGTLTISFGGSTVATVGQATGTIYPKYFVTAANTNPLTITPNATWEGTIDWVTIKQVTSTASVALQLTPSDGTTNPIEFRTGPSGSTAVSIGYQAGQYADSYNNADSVGIGYQALQYAQDGSNVAVGSYALRAGTNIGLNAAVGTQALVNLNYGYNNNVMGYYSLSNVREGQNNVAVGSAIGSNASGATYNFNDNVLLGYRSAFNLGSGSQQNVLIGTESGYNLTSATGNVFLGYQSGYSETGSNKLYIDNSNTTSPLIWGDFSTNVVNFNGSVGIGTTAPGYTLDVKSTGTDIARFIGSNSTGCTLSDGGIIACSSDRNLKKNILDTNLGLDAVMALRPVEFNWNSQVNGDKKYLGFIAQDVETLAPNLVTTDSNGYKQLNSIGLIPIVAKAIQEQQGLINTLQTNVQIPDFKIATVSSKLETLNTKVSSWDGLFITIQSVIQSIQDAIVALRDQFGLVQSDITSTKSEVASLSASLTSLNSWKEAIASGSGVLGASDSALLDHVATVSALTVQNQTTTFDLTVLNKLTTGVIELGAGIDGDEINASTGIRFQTLSQGPIDFMNGKVIIDVDGNLKAVKVSADRYAASKAQGTVGLGLLKAGDTSVTIETPSVNANSRIFVTALTKTNKPLYVSAIIEGSHFVVSLGETPLTNVRFNWWIVEEE